MTIASAIQAKQQQVSDSYTAVSNKGGTLPATQNLTNLATAISTIPSGGSAPVITSLNVTPTTSAQTITALSGTDGYSPVNVAAVTAAIDSDIKASNIKSGVSILGVTGTYEGSGGGEFQLTRVKDDNNVEIGTHFMDFTDGNGQKYKVVLLDAKYRNNSARWCSKTSTVTNMPLYSDLTTSNIWEAKETATQNTQLILDYCSANGYKSTACSHCRSKSFTIGGTTYYGQLPNPMELAHLAQHYNEFDSLDTSASSYTSTNFSSGLIILSSSQYSDQYCWWLSNQGALEYRGYKTTRVNACPVLEIPY